MRRKLFAIAAIALLASAGFASIANAADHRDSPLNVANPAADINDVYAFRSGANPNDLVLAISVNPLIAPSDNATRGVFDNSVTYQIHVDGNGDLKDDVTVNIHKDGDSLVFEGLTQRPDQRQNHASWRGPDHQSAGPIKVFAGLRDDPFFFDLAGFQTFLGNPQVPAAGLRTAAEGQPVDAFAGTNVLAIVVELPVTSVSGTSTPQHRRDQGLGLDRQEQPAHRPHGHPCDQHGADPDGQEGRLQPGRAGHGRHQLPPRRYRDDQVAARRRRRSVRQRRGRRSAG